MHIGVKGKLKIFFIGIKLGLCFALMISSTYALFTDRAQTFAVVTAGDMQMELLILDEAGQYVSIVGREENIFNDYDWESGQTRIANLKVVNKSNIPVKYSLQFLTDIGGLGGAIEYCAFEGALTDLSGESWETISQRGSSLDLLEGVNLLSGDSYIYMDPNEEALWTVAVHMKPDASDRYQGMDKDGEWCEIKVVLHAVQGNVDPQ